MPHSAGVAHLGAILRRREWLVVHAIIPRHEQGRDMTVNVGVEGALLNDSVNAGLPDLQFLYELCQKGRVDLRHILLRLPRLRDVGEVRAHIEQPADGRRIKACT